MTLRPFVYAVGALFLALAPAARAGGSTIPVVTVDAPDTAPVGRATSVVCVASDPEGIVSMTLTAAGADGQPVVIGTSSGVTSAAAQWTPVAAGAYTLRCEAVSVSGGTGAGQKAVQADGAAATGPVISALAAPGSAVLAGKAVTVSVTATSSTAGALKYQWGATGGTLAAYTTAFATWTAPSTAGTYTLSVKVTDAAGATATRTANVTVVLSIYQEALPVALRGPRKVAAMADGSLFVSDGAGQLHRLTRLGERIATSLQGVSAVATGTGTVFAGLEEGALLRIDAKTGRVLSRVELGMKEGPVGIAWDEARGNLWLAFHSGTVQVRKADGAQVLTVTNAGTTPMRRLVDVALDPSGKVWVATDRQGTDGTFHSFDAATGAYVKSLGAGSTSAGLVRVVGGIAFGPDGKLYVSDLFSGKVQVLGSTGALLGSVGKLGAGPGELRQPAGLAFLSNCDLVVANMDANRLDRFGAGGSVAGCPDDADCDGLPDAWELAYGLNPQDPTSAVSDVDGDGLNETEEYAAGTNPRSGDTDGDGYADGVEVASGFDPTNGDDHRPQLLAAGPAAVNPGFVKLSSTVSGADVSACTTQWEQVAGPRVALGDAASATPSFVARRAGAYRFRAVASCGGVASLPANVSVDVRNVTPFADGGRVVTVPAGAAVLLDGAYSSDANGDVLAFAWDQLLGTPVLGSTPGPTAQPALTDAGYYVFRLGASDGRIEGGAEVPVVVIGAEGVPTAIAASPVLAQVGDRVVLDGSASRLGPAATVRWAQVAGAPVALDGAASVVAAFSAPAPGRYAFEVSLEENGVRSPPARVEVFVAAAGGALPVARAAAPAVVPVGAPVVLDGAASGPGLTYGWRQVSGPAAGLNDGDAAVATAVPFQAGSYLFELAVKDGETEGLPAQVRIEARSGGLPIPVAVAAAPAAAAVGARVPLDGRASTGAAGFRWTQVEGPWVVVEQGAVGAFTPTVPGTYAFELEVDDGQVRSAPARVSVTVSQNGMEN
jgi:hypothetical protein